MKISIILPNYNSKMTIKKVLDPILKLLALRKDCELIIIDDKSNDGSYEIIKKLVKNNPLIKLYRNKINSGAYTSRNNGIKKSDGDIMVFIDSDCIILENWLDNLVNPIIYGQVCATQGVSIFYGKNFLQRIIQESEDSFRATINQYCERIDTRNCAILKKVLINIGLFNESLRRVGDAEVGLRLYKQGYKILFIKNAVVIHEHRAKLLNHLSVLEKQAFIEPFLIRKFGCSWFSSFMKISYILGLLIILFLSLFYSFFWVIFFSLFAIAIFLKRKLLFQEPFYLIPIRILYQHLFALAFCVGFINGYLVGSIKVRDH